MQYRPKGPVSQPVLEVGIISLVLSMLVFATKFLTVFTFGRSFWSVVVFSDVEMLWAIRSATCRSTEDCQPKGSAAWLD